MTVIVEEKTRKKKKRNNLKVVEIRHVQVPDAEERLNRAFKILVSRFDNSGDETKGR